MNSGCYENDISKIVLVSIKVIDPKECKEKEKLARKI